MCGLKRALLLAFEFTELFVVNSYLNPDSPRFFAVTLLVLSFAFVAPTPCAFSQTQQTPTAGQAEPIESATAAETEAAQKRLARARSLAAIGKLAAAASELEGLRAGTKDESVRDVTRVLLMAIFVEMPDYVRAASLLDESFRARATGQVGDAATHSYFALAGQTVNSVRTHLERYRSFGVNVTEPSELTPDAAGDIEQLRELLEHVVEQAKSLHDEQSKGGSDATRGLDAAALLEDAATVRMRIARHDQDRARWQSEVSEARQHLFSSEMRIASISEVPAPRPAPATASPTPKTTAPDKSASSPTRAEQRASDAGQKSSKKSRTQPQASEQVAKTAAPSAQAPTPSQPPGATQPPAASGGATASKPTGGGPVAVGSLTAKARQRIAPSYPALARAARISGSVTVFLVLNEKGEVESVQRADGPLQLQQAAVEAARRWKFTPTLIDGQPVRVTGYLNFNFAL
ncbi:MAG: periplasmic protein TonB [Acidobacteriota bacterium]|jgi:protein TonB|nr:periplasmic protein TonB [Acidobacteriota bacterium]